jgi:site-specific DNA-methyltransferase (adenine-specific)
MNKIFHGDSLKVLTEIEKESFQLIFADPPYNLSGKNMKTKNSKTGGDWQKVNEEWDIMEEQEFIDFNNKWISLSKEVLKPNGSIFIACSLHNIGEVTMGLKLNGLEIKNIITWQKSNPMPNTTRRVLTHSTEFIIWAVKGKGWIFNYEKLKKLNPERKNNGDLKQMKDVWKFPLVQGNERIKGEDGKAIHPTQKPEKMLNWIIDGFSNIGDTILDPFCGSGTTCKVAKDLNRNYVGIEREEKYIEVINKRLSVLNKSEDSKSSTEIRKYSDGLLQFINT